jgi:uncharacterized tellurite resistance protein B-like protein
MHIVFGLIGAILTILFLLDRLGVDLGNLNPFYWKRRRAWAKKYEGDPIYSVEDPMHLAALLIVGAAKLDGDLSTSQKKAALQQFESVFSLDSRAASELLGSSAHLLGPPQVIDTQLNGLADKNKDRFSRDQAESMIAMMIEVASADGGLTTAQDSYIDSMRSRFIRPKESETAWS